MQYQLSDTPTKFFSTFLFSLILIAPLLSCNVADSDKSLPTVNGNTVHINPRASDKTEFSKVVTNIKYIQLETNSNCLVSNIDKVLYKKGLYYIWDSRFNTLTIFNDKGRYISNIGAIGRAPGEFLSIHDVEFSKDSSSIYLLSSDSEKLIEYNLEGKYISDIKTNLRASNFGILNNDFYFFTNKNVTSNSENYNLIRTNAQGTIDKKLFKFSNGDDFSIGFSGFIVQNKYGLLYNSSFCDTVFQITEKGLYPKYVFDFGNTRIPKEIQFSNKDIWKTKYSYLGKDFLEYRSGIIFKYRDQDTLKTMFIGKLHLGEKTQNIEIEFPMVNLVGMKDSNQLISYIQPNTLIVQKDKKFIVEMYQSYPVLKQLYDVVNISDNPILITYTLK
ncbi:MAG TPA: 6-bladed beta-propeller [Pelobium sp.]|nr:6-bladed beta-propeller [Pelobium sp.]